MGQAFDEFIEPGVFKINGNFNKKFVTRIMKFRLKRMFSDLGLVEQKFPRKRNIPSHD